MPHDADTGGTTVLVLSGPRLADGRTVDVRVSAGLVEAVGTPGSLAPTAAEGTTRVDLSGYLLLPSPAEPHAHHDSALTAEVAGPAPGDPVSVRRRMTEAALLQLGHGATAQRTHVRVGGVTGLSALEAALDARRAGLAPFWLRLRPRHPLVGPGATARRGGPAPREGVLVVDAEDDFTAMLAHVLRATGREVRVVGPEQLADGAGEHRGPVVLGPGPGDPADPADPRIGALRRLAAELLAHHRGGVVGVCLGHQLLATALGLPVRRLPRPAQGVQREVELFGRRETVGFYNSFTARCDDDAAAGLAARSVAVARDADGTGVLALRGPGFAGVQFHPESVLTLDGPRLLDEALAAATRRPGVPAG
ncbi:hypothetical protein HCN52_17345 [Streptomyces bohaiensis]|uniref:Glutamine amidotransferase domain-containing protein n=1 Tax=Streptomyces bohaiensis TaxID=1431344 RepID=A0ABX1CC15_9ACTN|nr:hypothetical protein [Streptomyces bohaiensis]